MPEWRKNGEVDGELEIKALQLIVINNLRIDYFIKIEPHHCILQRWGLNISIHYDIITMYFPKTIIIRSV